MSTIVISRQIDNFLEVTKKSPDNLKLAKKIETGLPAMWINHLKKVLELTNSQIADVLGISGKTLERIRVNQASNKLNEVTSDRLYRILHIFFKTVTTLEDADEAKIWLKSPQFGLGNEIPIELLKTEAGTREIESLLGRIEHGVYS
jgi:putative toxin-antitoxin system antitoxin component (TIGR02293 family)